MRRADWCAAAVVSTLALTACGDRAPQEADSAAAVPQSRAGTDPPYEYATLDVPGAKSTVASDVTNDGVVVGWFEQNSVVRGFVHDGRTFTPVEYPGAMLTRVTSMAADGAVVGAYRKAGESKLAWHGFVRRPSGEFADVRHPDHPHGMAQRILDDGTILGCYHGADETSMRGIVVSGGRIAASDMPGSMHNGASSDGRRVVGILATERRAYVIAGGVVTYLEAPGAKATEAWDVNDAGTVVGAAVDSVDQARGVVFTGDRWTTLEVPGARSAVAFGINARGDVVGGWEDSTGRHRGFVARRRAR
jgi:uncharacterized membrane protein